MQEIKCPKCGNVIKMDEADYALILSQVKDAEFNMQLERRVAELQRQLNANKQLEIDKISMTKEMEGQRALEAKDREARRVMEEKEQLIARMRSEIESLRVKAGDNQKDVNMAVMQERERNNQAVMQERERNNQTVMHLRDEIARGRESLTRKENEAMMARQELTGRYEMKVRELEEELARIRDFKTKRTVKLIGESLEQHCNTQYNQMIAPLMPFATFDKDNAVVEGTKGDFVFRDTSEGMEYISIMFEMKNEADESTVKHRNADFFAKLDSDRRKKECEYAVLVSMLELDNELYNNGIYSVPGYDKMYVVRPDNFITILNLLVQAARKTLSLRRELVEARSQSLDVTNFESKLEDFKTGFMTNYERASKKFNDAIAQIDKSIETMQKIKESLLSSENQLRLANNKAEGLTIKRLTYGNKTMKEEFDKVRKESGGAEVVE